MSTKIASSKLIIESRAIEFIPENERHGSIFSQVTLWLGVNLNITAVVIGSLAFVSGSGIIWSIIGLFVGQVLGTVILALHAVQGPTLGLPQMISTRAQFGIRGAIIPLAVVSFECLGLSASGSVLAGQSMGALFHISTLQGIILFSVLTAFFTILGHDTIHYLGKAASFLGAIAFIYMFVTLFIKQDVSTVMQVSTFHFSTFLLAVSLSASWQISFGPFVADYSRYLPKHTNKKSLIAATMLGSIIGAQVSMAFGVFAAALAGNRFSGNEVPFIVGLSSTGAIAVLLYLAISIGKFTGISMNAYTSAMSLLTIFDSGKSEKKSKKGNRIFFTLLSVFGAAIIAIVGQHSFLSSFSAFVLFLLTFMTPWSAINLIEFYSYKESYDDQRKKLLDHNGILRGYNWFNISLYLVSVIIQIPFIATSIYTGPFVSLFDGADISWLIGLVFPTVVILICKKRFRSSSVND